MDSNTVDYKDSPYESEENYGVGNSFDLAVILRILKEDNDKIMLTQEKQVEVNAVILQSLSDLQ